MDSKVKVKLVTENDWDSIIDLYKGYIDRNLNIQNWLYLDNPCNPSYIYAIYIDNIIAGTIALIPVSFKNQHQEIVSYKLEDIYILPKYRGKGFYQTLTNEIANIKDKFIWVFTSNPKASSIKGFNSKHQLNIGYHNKVNLLALWKSNNIKLKKKIALSALNISSFSFSKRRPIDIQEGFSKEVELFYNNISNKTPYFIPKLNSKIYEWQYSNNPLIKELSSF